MNQSEIGMFISKKRKEKNLTQAQLAEKLGISNKTISKRETGKCMPDYGIIDSLCKELEITIAELMDSHEAEPDSIRNYDDGQILELVKRIQNLENQRIALYGILFMAAGTALFGIHFCVGGSEVQDFFSGILLGLSIGVMLVGIYLAAGGVSKQK